MTFGGIAAHKTGSNGKIKSLSLYRALARAAEAKPVNRIRALFQSFVSTRGIIKEQMMYKQGNLC